MQGYEVVDLGAKLVQKKLFAPFIEAFACKCHASRFAIGGKTGQDVIGREDYRESKWYHEPMAWRTTRRIEKKIVMTMDN